MDSPFTRGVSGAMSRPQFFCLRCGKAYASNDGVRKHAKRNHPNWIAEMDARNAHVFTMRQPAGIGFALAGRPKFLLPAPLSAPSEQAANTAVAPNGHPLVDGTFCQPHPIGHGGYLQAVPVGTASATAYQAYQQAAAQAQQQSQQQQPPPESLAAYAGGAPILPPVAGVAIGERVQAPLGALSDAIPMPLPVGWPTPPVPHASAAAVSGLGWQSAPHSAATGSCSSGGYPAHGSAFVPANPIVAIASAVATSGACAETDRRQADASMAQVGLQQQHQQQQQ